MRITLAEDYREFKKPPAAVISLSSCMPDLQQKDDAFKDIDYIDATSTYFFVEIDESGDGLWKHRNTREIRLISLILRLQFSGRWLLDWQGGLSTAFLPSLAVKGLRISRNYIIGAATITAGKERLIKILVFTSLR